MLSTASFLTGFVKRRDTRYQTRFQRLQRYYVPNSVFGSTDDLKIVNFEFEQDAVILEIPTASTWSAPTVCHHSQAMCRKAYMESGHWLIDSLGANHPGQAPPEQSWTWRNVGLLYGPAKTNCRLRLYGSEQARQLDHVVSSAVQDAELYFKLCSTPIWLRLLYSMTCSISPAAASILAHRVLWVQLRVIFFRHDTWEYRGGCTIFSQFYPFGGKSDWIMEFENWSEHFIAKQCLQWNYWLGRMFLGMESEYPEYKLAE